MTFGRVLTVAESQGRDLLRRRLAIVMMAALPGAFYVSVMGEELARDEDPWTITVGAIGVAWAVAGGAFFLSLASRRVDERLLLAGYRPLELLTGRLLFLLGFAAVVVAGYSTFLIVLSDAEAAPLVLAVACTGVIAVAAGLALASVLPRELEGSLALIALVGVQTSVPADAGFAPFLPFYGPIQLVRLSWNADGSVMPYVAHAVAATAILLAAAVLLWGRHVRVRPPSRRADSGAWSPARSSAS